MWSTNGRATFADLLSTPQEMKNGEIFRVGASDAGQRPQPVYAVGGAECSDAVNSRVAVCCVGSIESVAALEPVNLRVLANRVVHGKGKIPGMQGSAI
ncbi:MAG: hypothetical protein WA817_02030 [Candidatus Acidiferrum sp.]